MCISIHYYWLLYQWYVYHFLIRKSAICGTVVLLMVCLTTGNFRTHSIPIVAAQHIYF